MEESIEVLVDKIHIYINYKSKGTHLELNYAINHDSTLKLIKFHLKKGTLLDLPIYAHFSSENFSSQEEKINKFIKERLPSYNGEWSKFFF